MNGTELLQKLEDPSTLPFFEKLYGPEEARAGRKRYASLVQDGGELRLFTAAGRTELGGNHTDHNRGRVVAGSIQLDAAAVVALRADTRIFFRSTGYPDVIVDLAGADNRPDLEPKNEERGTTEALVRGIAAEFIKRGAKVKGFTVTADSTVLPGSGLSSSAAVEVLFGRIIDNLFNGGACTPVEIAQIGQKAENVYFGKPCGLMDQIACAYGGAVAIDFADPSKPLVTRLDVDFSSAGYALCIVNTHGSHADLTADYAAIPAEMKAVAAFFGKEVLRECEKKEVEEKATTIRQKLGDRALLRALHFFDENHRASEMLAALEKLSVSEEFAGGSSQKHQAIADYLQLVNQSGDSSWELLQNVFSPQNPKAQGIAAALALTRNFLRTETPHPGACRVHGGGFAGTIQAYIPIPALEKYRTVMDGIFGPQSVTVLRIRPIGAEEILL